MLKPIYLDYAATTPVDPQVVQAMLPFLRQQFGNPASQTHSFGIVARNAVERARQQVADLIAADPREIVWTSGATEAINLALLGAARAAKAKGRHIITSKTEHKAVLDTCRQLQLEGFEVSYLDPETSGVVNIASLEAALRKDTVLISLMQVNNEMGVFQDIASIGQLSRAHGVLLHIDAAQSVGKIPIALSELDVDLMSMCAHKIYGPKGIGALFVRRRPRARIVPLLYGGGQERGLRAGTLPVHQIVAMGEAFAIAKQRLVEDQKHCADLKKQLLTILSPVPGMQINGALRQQVANILNISFPEIDAEALLLALADDVALATGSACTSASQQPSHVLQALGCDEYTIQGSVRFSFGRFTTEQEMDFAGQRLVQEVQRLRELCP